MPSLDPSDFEFGTTVGSLLATSAGVGFRWVQGLRFIGLRVERSGVYRVEGLGLRCSMGSRVIEFTVYSLGFIGFRQIGSFGA